MWHRSLRSQTRTHREKNIGIPGYRGGGDGSIVIVKWAWTQETNWEVILPSSRWRGEW